MFIISCVVRWCVYRGRKCILCYVEISFTSPYESSTLARHLVGLVGRSYYSIAPFGSQRLAVYVSSPKMPKQFVEQAEKLGLDKRFSGMKDSVKGRMKRRLSQGKQFQALDANPEEKLDFGKWSKALDDHVWEDLNSAIHALCWTKRVALPLGIVLAGVAGYCLYVASKKE